MKRLFLAVAVLALGAATSWSLPLSFGIKAGVSVSKFTGSDAKALADNLSDSLASVKSKTDLTGGLFLSLGVGGAWAIQPEMLYVRKGTSIHAANATGDVNLDYLDVPVLLRLNLLPAKSPVVPFVFAGPSINFNVRSKLTGPGGTLDYKDYTKGTDVGFVLGGGIASGKFSLDARYEFGLSNPLKAQEGGFTPSIHNGTLYVLAGYKLF